jgi:N-acetylglutamate synthase
VIPAGDLDRVLDRAWPSLEYVQVDGWQVRFAAGVTRRANSVLPIALPDDVEAAIAEVERIYGEHGQPAVFQLSPRSHPADLDEILARRGYLLDAATLVCVADAGAVADVLGQRASEVLRTCVAEIADEPDRAWLDFWRAVDGRGDDRILRRILTGVASRYVTLRTGDGIAAVGRLALVDGYGGIYAVAVRTDLRGLGLGGALLYSLARAAPDRQLFLQVMTDNQVARRLYRTAGFHQISEYHYRVQRFSPGDVEAVAV